MLILRYIIVPLLVVYVAYLLIFESTRRFPIYVLSAIAVLGVLALVRARRQRILDSQRGWRVGHVGRDAMYYEEFRDGAWHRIDIDGEMLTGKAHHVIYFGSLRIPDWATVSRDEIIRRIKIEFHPPEYEYDDT